jgi:alkylation response protein AidB-like acyl-CoA dehydrogenase
MAGAPMVVPFGITMVGPVIYTFGSDAQKDYYLPRILASEDWWCQGYSEPGSGSDLASLQTRAIDEGDHYLVNGQKIWTTTAHLADMMFCLVRTDSTGKPQEGISFLLIDMTTSGITVEPIISMDLQHSLNQVFFEDVVVPKANLVGEENRGWTYAKFLLEHERTGIAGVARCKHQLAHLKAIAKLEHEDGISLSEDPEFKARLADIEMRLTALEYTDLRVLAANDGMPTDTPYPGAMPSMLKILGSEVQQAIAELLVEALGPGALPYQPIDLDRRSNEPPLSPSYAAGIVEEHLHGRAASIYGGTNEIQKNIIAKMILSA